MLRFQKGLIWFGLISLVTTFVFAQGADDDVIATANGLTITQQEYRQALLEYPKSAEVGWDTYPWYLEMLSRPMPAVIQKDLEAYALKRLIQEKLAFETAKALLPTNEEAEASIQESQGYLFAFSGKDVWLSGLAEAGHTPESLRELVRRRMAISRYLDQMRNDIQVSAEEIREYFDAHKSQFVPQERILGRMIVVNSRSAVREILAQSSKGMDFAGLAQKYSTLGSDKRGALGSKSGSIPTAVSRKDLKNLPSRLLDEAFDRLEGGITPVISRDKKFYLIKVEKYLKSEVEDLKKIESGIAEKVKDIKVKTRADSWLSEVVQNADIKFVKNPNSSIFDAKVADLSSEAIQWSDLQKNALFHSLTPLVPFNSGYLRDIAEIPIGIVEIWKRAYGKELELQANRILSKKWASDLGYEFFGANRFTFEMSENLASQLAKVSPAEIQENYQRNIQKYTVPPTLSSLYTFRFSNLEEAKKFQRETVKLGEIPSGYQKNELIIHDNWTIATKNNTSYFKFMKTLPANLLAYVSLSPITLRQDLHIVEYGFNYIPGYKRSLRAVAPLIGRQILELRRTKLKKEWNDMISKATKENLKSSLEAVMLELEQHLSPQ